jgi:hypothetical protein
MAQIRHTTEEQTIERQKKYGGKTRAMYLENFLVMGMLPTPARVQMSYREKEGWTWTGLYWKNEKGRKKQTDLTATIQKTLGTTSQLNPRFVAEMMGFPPNWTELPFQNGETNQ